MAVIVIPVTGSANSIIDQPRYFAVISDAINFAARYAASQALAVGRSAVIIESPNSSGFYLISDVGNPSAVSDGASNFESALVDNISGSQYIFRQDNSQNGRRMFLYLL